MSWIKLRRHVQIYIYDFTVLSVEPELKQEQKNIHIKRKICVTIPVETFHFNPG